MAQRLQYSETYMENAVAAVRGGMPALQAAKNFKVPRTTILDKVNGRVPLKRKIGPDTVLTTVEEHHLVNWMIQSSKCGFPVTKNQLLESVQMLIKELGRETPFTNGKPGRRWFESFMRRHPELSQRISQNLTKARANVTEDKLRAWFAEIEEYIQTNDLKEIWSDPKRVYNCDETAFFLSPKGEKVIVRKGEKAIYSVINNDEKECVTTLLMCNAAGDIPPPLVMFAYKRLPNYIATKVPPDWALGRSDNGWMTGESFFEYISNIFFEWLKNNNVTFPVVLFVDGHSSHLTMQLSEFCSKNQIILISLFPNSTHILQPLDVAVFRPLKLEWKKAVTNWRIENNGVKFKKEDFAPLLKKVIDGFRSQMPSILANGFRACGLFPLQPNSIKFEKFFNTRNKPNENATNNADKTLEFNVSDTRKFLKFFESRIQDKIELFQLSAQEWEGPSEDKSLFLFWKSLKEDCCHVDTQTVNNPIVITVLPDEEYTKINGDLANTSDACSLGSIDILNITSDDVDVDLLYNIQDNTDDFNYTHNGKLADRLTPIHDIAEYNDDTHWKNNEEYYKTPEKQNTLRDDRTPTKDTTPEEGTIQEEGTKKEGAIPKERTIPEEVTIPEEEKTSGKPQTSGKKMTQVEEKTSVKVNKTSKKETTSEENKVTARVTDRDHTRGRQTLSVMQILTDREKAPERQNTLEKENTPDKQKTSERPKSTESEKTQDKENIPTPFKKALFWAPKDDKKLEVKRKLKEKLPAVASSQKWQEYQRKKEQKKQIETDEKEKRKIARQTKQKRKTEVTKEIKYSIGDYVIVKYYDMFFPGLIISNSAENEYSVRAMEKSGQNWKWPKVEDKLDYNVNDIMRVITKPKLINKRGIYEVPEISGMQSHSSV